MKKGSFARKLILSYLVLAVIPLLVLLSVVVVNAIISTKNTLQTKLDSAAMIAEAQFASIMDTMEFISLDMICSDKFIQMAKGLTYPQNTTFEEKVYYLALEASICTYSHVQSTYCLSYFNTEGHFITNDKYNNMYSFQYRLDQEVIRSLDWISEADRYGGKAILLPVSDNAVPHFDEQALTLVRVVRDPGKIIGYLAVQIRISDMDYMFGIDELNDSSIMIQRGDHVIFATENFPMEKYLTLPADKLKKEYLISSVSSESGQSSDQIKVTLASPMSLVYEQVSQTILTFLLEGILLLVLTIGGILVFSRQFSMPLVALKNEMGATTLKNLNLVSSGKPYERYEETKYLYQEFVQMRKRLDTMIQNEVTLKTLHMRELLNSLQSQINPHFLYNTLNVIGIMGVENGDSRVYDACIMLSELLRYFISDRSVGTTTIRKEVENTKVYLQLMQLRFEDRIRYTLECDECVMEQPVLRLIMQPFVENIFEHAYNTEHISIEIKIKVFASNGRWIISVEDDGAGIDPDTLFLLQRELDIACSNTLKAENDGRDADGIGMENTILRLKLFYRDEFTYTVENKDSGGFRVELSALMKEV